MRKSTLVQVWTELNDGHTKKIHISKKYNISKSTLSIWRYMKLENLIELKFHYCKICNNEFYQKSPAQLTCGSICSAELRRENKRLSYHRNKHKQDRYADNLKLKKWRIKQKILKKKENQ